jgi:hypothetical protein
MLFRAAQAPLLAVSLAVLALASCSMIGPAETTANVVLSFGPSAARALETGWEGGVFPALSSITVTVSADDMRTVTKTVPGDQRSISISVPVGKQRLVEVTAVPSSSGLAAAFSGNALADIGYRTATKLSIRVELSQSCILLPDVASNNLHEANSIASGISLSSYMTNAGLSVDSDFEFDDHGRIYLGYSDGLRRITALSGGTSEDVHITYAPNAGIAYDSSTYRVYYVYFSGAFSSTFDFVDITQATPSAIGVTLPAGFTSLGKPVAADAGYAYVVSNDPTTPRIVKLSVGAASGSSATATEVGSATFTTLGLEVASYQITSSAFSTSMKVEDMLAKDGILYVVASQSNATATTPSISINTYCRGKVLALSTSNLSLLWQTGWSGDTNRFPTDPSTQFYAPRRIIGIMPKKLYIADDGHRVTGVYPAASYIDVDRVMDVNTDSHAVSAVNMNIGTVGFFNNFGVLSSC